ncbi:MAG: TetR/AcrR family transcriptional regulator [Deinococcota bacterium]
MNTQQDEVCYANSVRKGKMTRERLLWHGLQLVSVEGFRQVSVGALAKASKLSKSGVFAHFGSSEALQLALLDAAAELANKDVFEPAMQAPVGLAQLRTLFERLLGWTTRAGLPGGCPFVAAASEFDDLEGSIHDYLIKSLEHWLGLFQDIIQHAVAQGELDPSVDAKAFTWQLFGLYNMHHTMQHLMHDPDADRIALQGFETLVNTAQIHADA